MLFWRGLTVVVLLLLGVARATNLRLVRNGRGVAIESATMELRTDLATVDVDALSSCFSAFDSRLAAIEAAIAESDIVIMAWGSSRFPAERESFVRELLQRHSGKVLLRTKSHPSRGRAEGFIQSYPL